MTNSSVDAAMPVLPLFAIDGDVVDVAPYERGHIHNTFVSTWKQSAGQNRYLHQQLNETVFSDITGLMHNIECVTSHLSRKIEAGDVLGRFHPLSLVPTREGATFLSHESGPWRTYHFIENTESFDLCESAERAFETARAFGRFQAWLADMKVTELKETIPNFFSTPYRYEQFDRARGHDRAGRVKQCDSEIGFVERHRTLSGAFEDRLRAGSLPLRIVHGDTKLNNILFDRDSGAAVSIVDLDTCMPAYSLYDFGDLVRFTAATACEDERDLARVGVDMKLYQALARGYLDQAGPFLTEEEVELMPLSAKVVTLTIGVRFLTDHLNGDVYFKVSRPGQNLDRARVQFKMVEQMDSLPGFE
ncbi:MAG: aminoglycoside phosphotransferase family protein [Planctomycetota bacterium]